jgi:hypothetical protein
MPSSLDRRAFCSAVAGLGAAACLPSPAEGASSPASGYIDVHTHLGRVWNTKQTLTAEELLRWMDASDVAQAIVLPLVSPESSSYPISTDYVLEQTRPYRDRLIPFCSVDPRTSFSGKLKGLVDMLREYVDAGAKGFGEHKPGVAIGDPCNMLIYEACGQAELPILFHLDNLRNMDTPGLPGLEKALKAFPQTTFIGHGPGWWASISGGLVQADLYATRRTPVTPGGAIDRLMDAYPNIFGDLSAGSGANAISRDPSFGREFLIRRADRLMFGTDMLSPGQAVPQLELYRTIDLPADVQAKIFRDNARRLLRLV